LGRYQVPWFSCPSVSGLQLRGTLWVTTSVEPTLQIKGGIIVPLSGCSVYFWLRQHDFLAADCHRAVDLDSVLVVETRGLCS
jgi:hypothetical protein